MKISEFQQSMKDIFLDNDKKRGIDKTFMWLTEEVGELASAIIKDDKENIAEEISDIIAWSFSVANLYGIDMEKELFKKYPAMCSKCDSKPCNCDHKL